MSEFAPPVECSCGETRTRRDDAYVLTQSEGKTKPVYSNSKLVCAGSKETFEARVQREPNAPIPATS